MGNIVKVRNISIGGKRPVVLIAGPCVIESQDSAMWHAERLKKLADRLGIPFIYKSSYDKANRMSVDSYRGPGLIDGINILRKIRRELNIPVLSDIHCKEEVSEVKDVLDVIQIPAYLCRQTDLVLAAARTGKPINIKKGQFMAPWDIRNIVRKIESVHNKNILLTDRGVSFGYNALISDLRSILIMKKTGYPVIYDATHSVQVPGGLGTKSGGEREFIPHLALAAVSCGADAVFIEVHKDPSKALCDGPNMLKLDDLEGLLVKIMAIEKIVRKVRS